MKSARDSLLELYRIIVMLAIVAHHYVVNSGVLSVVSESHDPNVMFLRCFGGWGKIGINCFVLITGYFMCTSQITLKKFLKLYLEIVFYSIVLNAVFVLTGYEPLTTRMMVSTFFPIAEITTDCFIGAFLVFFLTIPFLNVLVTHMDRRQHGLLIALLVIVFSILPFIPSFVFAYNHVEWFAILYIISSYLRKYPSRITENRKLWALISIAAVICGIGSIFAINAYNTAFHKLVPVWYFLADANKITALAVAICCFMAFKPKQIVRGANEEIRPVIPNSRIINNIASATFGVLLIHANSDAMRRWLWQDVCNVKGNYLNCSSIVDLLAYSTGCVLVIFVICVAIDLLRQRFIERPLFDKLFPEK